MNQSTFSFSILSFNVFGTPFHPQRIIRSILRNHVRKRFREIARELEQKNFDILAFQEVYTYPHFLFLRHHLRSFPYVAYTRSLYGPKGGMVIFTKLPFEKVEYITFRKSGVYWKKSATGPLTRKGMLLMKVTNRPLWIVNTHLTQNSDGNWSEENHYARIIVSQLKQCADSIKTLQKVGMTVLLTGDFNVPKNSLLYKQFLSDSELSDVFSQFHFPTYHAIFAPKGEEQGRIDFMFTNRNKGLKVTEKDHLFTQEWEMTDGTKTYLSDHIALSASFEMS